MQLSFIVCGVVGFYDARWFREPAGAARKESQNEEDGTKFAQAMHKKIWELFPSCLIGGNFGPSHVLLINGFELFFTVKR